MRVALAFGPEESRARDPSERRAAARGRFDRLAGALTRPRPLVASADGNPPAGGPSSNIVGREDKGAKMTPRLFATACTAALLSALPVAAFAADEASEVSEVVVATRAPNGISPDDVAGSLSVITPAQIEQRQVRVVSDVLRDVPGISVSRTGGVGNFTQVRVRGAEANQVLTLVDGIEAADPFFGEFDWGTLLADDLARVEILRGQQSALYGSDAIGGVINYVTPTGREAQGYRLRVEGGSQGTFGAAGRAAGVVGDLDYAFTGAYQTTDGYVVAPGGDRDIGSTLGSLAAKGAYKVSDQLTLRGVARWTSTKADVNGQDFGTTGFALDSDGSTVDATSLYGLAAADLSLMDGRWTHSLSIQGVDSKRDTVTAFIRSGGDKGTRVKGSYVTSFRIESGSLTHTLTGAVDLEHETYQNTAPNSAFGPDTTKRGVDNTGLVGQYDLAIGEVAGLGAALRYDENDLFDNATTYRLQGFWRVRPDLRLRAAAGSGIKNPSQTELFGFNASAFPFHGNPNLKPEKSEGWEIGADLSLAAGKVKLGATWFDSTLKDEIFTDFSAPIALCTVPGLPVPFSCTTTGNRTTDSRQKGLELYADARLGEAWTVNAAYTWLDAVEAGAEEMRRPPQIASLNVIWRPTDRGSATLTVRYNGETFDTEFANFTRVQLKAFTLVNLAGAWKLNDTVELYGRVENLFDEDYQEVSGFNAAPRAAYAGGRTRF